MILPDKKIKRLGIYFFFDKDGIVDQFITYFLADLVKSLDRLVIVCNGKLTSQGEDRLREYTNEILVRENKGLDVWAYKTGLEYVGWKTCETYDELVLCNSTVMGPVFPFEEMFSKMREYDVDFWGITKTHRIDGYDFGYNPYGYLPEHIQSYFIVYRKSLIQSEQLQHYWDTMPEIQSYNQSVGLYESAFTKLFADKGFKWDVYVNTDDFEGITDQPVMFYPKKLISERHCPIFKRRLFFHSYKDMLNHTAGETSLLLYDYLVAEKLYDINMIWDNILRSYNLADISRQLHLNYTLSTVEADTERVNHILKREKTALVMHLYFMDMLEESFQLAASMPSETDVYITTNTEEKKTVIERIFQKLPCSKLQVKVIENRGRDVSALLVGMREVVREYDLVCFSHDKKTAQSNPGSVGLSFAYKCYANVLYNRAYVENVITLFDENPRMGMLVPPAPLHGEYRELYGQRWGMNYSNTKKLCKELGIRVPMSETENPIAPYGSVFWVRPKAMKKILDKNWTFEDFPQEPLAVDGTISHAIERLYGFAAQAEGYYSAIGMSDVFARIEYTNLDYYVTHLPNDIERELRERLDAMYASTSWKVSKPVRILGELVKKMKKRKLEKGKV